MSSISKWVDVNVPATTPYNQWTQFETFPQFMEGVIEITQLDDCHLHWRSEVFGRAEEWDAVITEQIPNRRIAWKSTTGVEHCGVVTFHHLSETTSRIIVLMIYDPKGFVETLGDALGLVERRVEGDLYRFKKFVEGLGKKTGAWRGAMTKSLT